MAEAHLTMEPDFVKFGDMHSGSGYAMMKEMLGQPDPPKAFFIINHFMHIGATNYVMSRATIGNRIDFCHI